MRLLEQAIIEHQLAGCVLAVVDRERLLLEQALGYADLEQGRRQAVGDLFFLASSSKPLAATAILTVTPLEDVRRLLSHTAGTFPNATRDPAQSDLVRNPQQTLAQAAARIAAQPLAYPPGDGAAYSDAGFLLAGRSAEAATGLEFDEVIRTRLFDPWTCATRFTARTVTSPGAWR